MGEEGGGVDGGDFGIQDTKKDFNDADARQENKVSIDPNAEAEQSCDFKLPKKPTNDLKKSTTDNTPHDKDGGVKKTQRLQGAQDLCEDLVRFVLECVVLTPKKVATFLVPRVRIAVINIMMMIIIIIIYKIISVFLLFFFLTEIVETSIRYFSKYSMTS